MRRPCILVMDAEFPGSISSRKLVIETAKFNVITAYSGHEALATLERFPRLDAAVLNAADQDLPCAEVVGRMKDMVPGLPIIVTSAMGDDDCGDADFNLRSYEPAKLLETLRVLFPSETETIQKSEKKLTEKTEGLAGA
jgi:DNA-binding response OmpR family regulator